MFGFGPSDSPAWRDLTAPGCSGYKYCELNPATGLVEIKTGTCPVGTAFSDIDHMCLPAEELPSCVGFFMILVYQRIFLYFGQFSTNFVLINFPRIENIKI